MKNVNEKVVHTCSGQTEYVESHTGANVVHACDRRGKCARYMGYNPSVGEQGTLSAMLCMYDCHSGFIKV